MNKKQKLVWYFSLIAVGLLFLPMASNDYQFRNDLQASELERNDAKKIRFKMPIEEGKVSARYGNTRHPYTNKIMFHKGIDIAAKLGTKVFAAAEGIVIEVNHEFEKDKGPGKYVVIQHEDGYITKYYHLGNITVSQGQSVKAGAQIASVGNTGASTGPHLHFEICKDDKPLNPDDFIDFKHLMKD